MLYYIQYLIITEPHYPVSHQMGHDINIKCWQQVSSLKLDDLVNDYMFNQQNGKEPVFIFFKYENDNEKNLLNNVFKNSIVESNKFNIYTNLTQLKENIIVVQL